MSHHDPERTVGGDGWDDSLETVHLFGDVHFVNRYATVWWALAGVLSLLLPPVGIGLLVYYTTSGLYTEGDEIAVALE